MEYAKVTGNSVDKFPYSYDDLRADNPNVSFPPTLDNIHTLERFNVYPVTRLDDPNYDPDTEELVEGVPEDKGGNKGWEVQRVKSDLSQEEKDKKTKEKNKKNKTDGIEADAEFQALLAGTLADIDARIDATVTDLASAITVIKTLARGLSVVADQHLD